jgi:hypothetical protein
MRNVFHFVCYALLLVPAVFAADQYYYEDGQRIDVTPVQEYVVVKAAPNFNTWSALQSGKAYLDENFEPFPLADGFMLLGINTGYSSTAASADLRQTEGMLSANNVYEHPGGGGSTSIPPTTSICTSAPLQPIQKSIRYLKRFLLS